MDLRGRTVRLRTVEPGDTDLLLRWENDPDIWRVSETTAPYTREQIEQFIENQQHDITETRQLRLIVETLSDGLPVGILDLFEYDPLNSRAGVGILTYPREQRGKGYAFDALETACGYAAKHLHLHQLWCNVGSDNTASLRVFTKAGFEQSGVKRAWNRTAEGYEDEIILQKIL